jgi:putative restriction endonuclease
MNSSPDLKPWLNLTSIQAQAQWAQIKARDYPLPGKRQQPFLPVEVLLCYALFQVINPHSFGGNNLHRLPESVHRLAKLLKRPPGSLTSKMLNLEGFRPNGGRLEPELFLKLLEEPKIFAPLYKITINAAWEAGLEVPDILEGQQIGELLGQDELGSYELEQVLEEAREEKTSLNQSQLSTKETERLTLTRTRLGQHRFAFRVLQDYDYRCGFCGFPAAGLSRMLIASHIKPWRSSSTAERLDPRNGIAACPLHDVAFDTGLITVNGGLRIHRATPVAQLVAEPGYFREPVLRGSLLLPEGQLGPGQKYLLWHQQHCFQGSLKP